MIAQEENNSEPLTSPPIVEYVRMKRDRCRRSAGNKEIKTRQLRITESDGPKGGRNPFKPCQCPRILLTSGFWPVAPVYAPIDALMTEKRRPMIDSTTPAMAIPRFSDRRPFMPNIRPMIVTGKPRIGSSHTNIPIIPSTSEATAFPPPDVVPTSTRSSRKGAQNVVAFLSDDTFGIKSRRIWKQPSQRE
jgi:hypothetical protein